MKIAYSKKENKKPRFITLLEEALSVMSNYIMIGDASKTEIIKRDIDEFLNYYKEQKKLHK